VAQPLQARDAADATVAERGQVLDDLGHAGDLVGPDAGDAGVVARVADLLQRHHCRGGEVGQ
jgi:hypothetical protein